MKSKLGIKVMLLLVVTLTVIACNAKAAPKFEKTYKKADNTKTWVIYEPAGHMEVGDKFRIKFLANGSKFQLIPFFELRSKWGHKEKMNFLVGLSDEGEFLCGMTQIETPDHKNDDYKKDMKPHGLWHIFVIKVVSDNLDIIWSDQSFEELHGQELTEMCQVTSEQNHGGRAHAEPN